MSLPSQDALDDIKNLITEITGFQTQDENFSICERYCLSHVVHHSYPFINRTTVKNLVNSYVSRFYSHGYFRVSQELNHQVKRFLSNEKLFEKNPQYDIQWCLLSLVSSLSSNLTSVKKLPELLPIEDEEKETEDIDWKEYLTQDLPQRGLEVLSSDTDEFSEEDDNEYESDMGSNDLLKESDSLHTEPKLCQENKDINIIFDNKVNFNKKTTSEVRRKRMEEFLSCMRSNVDLENDFYIRGNISEKFDTFMNQQGIHRKSQFISEFEVMQNILYQFQTGERIFLRKGLLQPALTSVTQDTLSNFLEYLQPYFKIIRSFTDFDADVTAAMYPEKCQEGGFHTRGNHTPNSTDQKRKISNVLYIYNVMLREALEPFQQEVTGIVENLGSYTLIKMERKLQPHLFYLTSLFHVHNKATQNWKKDCNWMSSVRILSVLYNSIMDASSTRMSFLYLNLFLRCFQVYLDKIDSWISSMKLFDPREEFIVYRSSRETGKTDNSCLEYEIHSYKTEIENWEAKEVPILDFIGRKMGQVGQSLEILRRLNRFVALRSECSGESSHQLFIKIIKEKIRTLGKASPQKEVKPEGKKRSIFTMTNLSLGLERDFGGGGDDSAIEGLLIEEPKEEEKEDKTATETGEREDSYSCREFIHSMVRNPFFKLAFDDVGIKHVRRKLAEAKARERDGGDEPLMVIKEPEEGKSGVFPLHKIISEALHTTLGDRVSDACALVKEIILVECDLPNHLSLLRSVLLFNNAYLIQSFILALFTQSVTWGSSYSLTLHLRECVRGLYKDQASCLSVTLSKNGVFRNDNVLDVVDLITIGYEAKWPLALVFNQDVMRKYNEIFRLALKLKWAHWALSGLHFQSKDEEERVSKSTCHRLRLLRFWFLSSLGRINNYFMAQMIPPELETSSCTDLKDIIQAHGEFIEKIHRDCLLGEKAPEGKKLILETLIPLCMDLWLEGNAVEEGKLSAMEKTFASCHLQLSRLMSSLEK